MAGLTHCFATPSGFAVLATDPDSSDPENSHGRRSIGVVLRIITNLVLLPLPFLHRGVARRGRAVVSAGTRRQRNPFLLFFAIFTDFPGRSGPFSLRVWLGGAAVISSEVQIGDIDPGAPDLRPNSDQPFTGYMTTTMSALERWVCGDGKPPSMGGGGGGADVPRMTPWCARCAGNRARGAPGCSTQFSWRT